MSSQQCTVLTMETCSLWELPEVAVKLYLNISRLLADRLVIANEMLFDFRVSANPSYNP